MVCFFFCFYLTFFIVDVMYSPTKKNYKNSYNQKFRDSLHFTSLHFFDRVTRLYTLYVPYLFLP